MKTENPLIGVTGVSPRGSGPMNIIYELRWGYRGDNKENNESRNGDMTKEVRAAHRKKTPDVVIDCDLASKMTVTSLE